MSQSGMRCTSLSLTGAVSLRVSWMLRLAWDARRTPGVPDGAGRDAGASGAGDGTALCRAWTVSAGAAGAAGICSGCMAALSAAEAAGGMEEA
jgi:hypothetical protein